MTLTIGQALGPYRVAAKLGEGGPPSLARGLWRELRRGLAVAQRSSL